MSDCSGDMDFGNDVGDVADDMDIDTGATEETEATAATEASCANCNVSYDGVDKLPIAGGACGHTQCNSCWQENDCYKCKSKSTDDNHEVHIQTPRDFLSPEPPQSSAGNGSSTSNDENKAAVHASQIEQAQVTAPSVGLASGSTVGAVSSPSSNTAVNGQAQVTAPSVGIAYVSTVGAAASPSLNTPVFAQPANAHARVTVSATRLASRATEGVAASPSLATITVKCINGTTVTLKVNLSCTTVQETKRLVHQQSGISPERQHLLYRGKTMEDIARTLKSYNVTDGSTLQMGARCYGG